MTDRQIQAVARRIAVELFESGAPGNPVAERLILWRDSDQKDLGGWGRNAVYSVVYKHLLDALVKPEPVGKPVVMPSRERRDKPKRRTKAEVMRERQNAVLGGCCNRFADNMACDCLEEAK